MKTGIVIPWRPQPSRLAAFDFVMSWYREMYPDYPIYLADGGGKRFNVSAARNAGCKEAFEDGCDVVIVSDADALIEKKYLDEAINYVRKRNSLCLPFSWTGYPSLEKTSDIIHNKHNWTKADGIVRSHDSWVGGLCVISRIAFEDVNGWDENFEGWGHEDITFYLAFTTLHGEVKRLDGYLTLLQHEDRDESNESANIERYFLYEKTAKTLGESGIRDLIKDNMP